jgi:hypothetical protein
MLQTLKICMKIDLDQYKWMKKLSFLDASFT